MIVALNARKCWGYRFTCGGEQRSDGPLVSSDRAAAMPTTVVEYGLTVAEHRAAAKALLELPHPQCPECNSPCWSKGLVYRKRAGVYVRQSRCRIAECRTVTTLLPAWMAVFVAATLPEVEQVIEARESGATWRACAQRAGLPHNPSIYRRWYQSFSHVMSRVLPSIACLNLAIHDDWVAQLRNALNVVETGESCVFIALRWRLFNDNGAIFGPLRIFTHGRVRARDIRSP